MSSVASIALSAMTVAPRRPDAVAPAGRAVADRFRVGAGRPLVEQAAAGALADGMLMKPNASLTQDAPQPFSGYGLAFNSPIMHVYSRTTNSLVNILA